MKHFVRIAKHIDIFGVPVPILTHRGEEKFKSLQGGLITTLISVLGLIYFIYMMDLWINGKISPNISTNQKTVDYAEFSWEEGLVYFKISDPASSIDPFSKTNNYITPLLFKVEGASINESPKVLFSDEQYKVEISNGTIILNSKTLSNQSDDNFKSSQHYLLVFAVCDDKYMPADGYCASEEDRTQYLSEFHGFISINFKLEQFNFTTNELEIVTKTIYQALLLTHPQYSFITIKQQVTELDDGYLMINKKYHQSTYDFSMIDQSVNSKFISNILKQYSFLSEYDELNSITAMSLNMDNIQINQIVTQPKLSAILAQIGSIIQVIFFLKYIAIYLNSTLIEEDQFHQIVAMYYPNLKNILIKRNIFGSPSGAECLNPFHKLKSDFMPSYLKLIDVAKQKTCLTNIVYEISRLQFIIEQRFGQEALQDCHELGSKAYFSEDQQQGVSSGTDLRSDLSLERKDISETIQVLAKTKKDI